MTRVVIAVLLVFLAAGCGAATEDRAEERNEADVGQVPEYSFEEPVEDCDPSYPDLCISPDEYDLDCDDVEETDFVVEGDDPHGFDADLDGIGCETAEIGGTFEEESESFEPPPLPEPEEELPEYEPPDYGLPEYDYEYEPDVELPDDYDYGYGESYDLDCDDYSYGDIPVGPSDPNGLDRDGDGIGCE